jgi:hypothetical protein
LQRGVVVLGILILIVGIGLMLYTVSVTVPSSSGYNPNCSEYINGDCTYSVNPYLIIGAIISLVGLVSVITGIRMLDQYDIPSSSYAEIKELENRIALLESSLGMKKENDERNTHSSSISWFCPSCQKITVFQGTSEELPLCPNCGKKYPPDYFRRSE